MIQTKTYDIKSCDDFELDIKRKSLLNFFLTYDDSKKIEAIICIIPGLGADANESYKEHLAVSIASNLNVAVLSVNYHCIANRPQLGAKATLDDDIDKLIFRTSCEAVGFELEKDFEIKSKDTQYVDNIINSLNLFIALGKVNGKFLGDFRLNLHFTLQAPNGDYQNFGIMSAIDVINSILFIKQNPPFDCRGGGLHCILVGSSHGGYIANLCAKISPWNVDAVVDNSSWNISSDILKNKDYSQRSFKTIGYGKEIDYTKYSGVNVTKENLIFCCSDKTKWTSNSTSPYFCSKSRLDIRNINDLKHLAVQSKSNKPIYVSYHSTNDQIANCYEKFKFYENLKLFKFDSNLTVIKDENQVDGKFIKNLNHGMDMSIKTLILKEVPEILEKLKTYKKPKKAKKISYQTDEWIYHFKQNADKLELVCERI
ncbi:hypothetical protein CFT85387_06070 [Campylobacter fetus subsp. testudinum]|uniref:DUF2920 family protein n=1 Tax=Campylobacter fetus TaxID=196 RepID=UPI0008189637|nr:DUF2920 family protein [Campylobacter fetus]OCR96184.1 hypothetical protein CFT12S02847_04665 [Campylobacter fetus subsp. testudinum]OCS00535.1 hypothetical protein CFT85387_06070 [Campylobacter fetus subsp. testudinum]